MNCQICGAGLPSDALFCGECGSSTSATPQSRQRYDSRPSDTTVIEPITPRQSTGVISVSVPTAPTPSVEGEAASAALTPASLTPATLTPAVLTPAASAPATAAPIAEEPVVSTTQPRGAASGISFVLQFSTGESCDVSGNGLIGRRPLPQPNERFDHLIQINDTGRSVSKSHLEFGLHNGELWISDRASGNGTLVRRSDGSTLPCEPGRRYLVARGTRVEIGEQFFVIA